MEREKYLEGVGQIEMYKKLLDIHSQLDNGFNKDFYRSLPLAETFLDRWSRAEKLGFGKGTSIYDASLVFGDVKVGQNCWIGPFSIIDGSGGLEIGNHCTISTGVQIYTHDNVKQTLSSGRINIEREKTVLGNNVYIGPNSIITKGVKIGNYVVIGSSSFVNKDIPDYAIVVGQPARQIGKVKIENEEIHLDYNH